MTIMALAEQRPELFGDRVVGVALIGTSSGKLAELTFGLPAALAPVARRVVPFVTRGMRARPSTFELSRRIGTDLAFVLTEAAGVRQRRRQPVAGRVRREDDRRHARPT